MNNLVRVFTKSTRFGSPFTLISPFEYIHVIFRILQLITLYITVVDKDIVDQIQYTSNKEILYADFNVKHIKFDDERNLNQEKTSHTKQKSSRQANFPLWLYFLSKKVYKQKVN